MSKKCACGRDMVLKSWKHTWVCTRCGRTKPEEEIPTNADHIRSMTDEELGLFLGEWAEKHLCWMSDGAGEALYWLKQPYREDSNG